MGLASPAVLSLALRLLGFFVLVTVFYESAGDLDPYNAHTR